MTTGFALAMFHQEKQQARRASRSHLTLEQLIGQTCNAMAVDARLLASPSRDRHLARVRAVIARQAVEERIATISAVARAFGRDESSVREGVTRLTRMRRE